MHHEVALRGGRRVIADGDAIFLDSKIPGRLSSEDVFRRIERERPELVSRTVLVLSNVSDPTVRAFVDAARAEGLRVGLYCSPWDRNAAVYGTPAYNDLYADQLTELLTRYGTISEDMVEREAQRLTQFRAEALGR